MTDKMQPSYLRAEVEDYLIVHKKEIFALHLAFHSLAETIAQEQLKNAENLKMETMRTLRIYAENASENKIEELSSNLVRLSEGYCKISNLPSDESV